MAGDEAAEEGTDGTVVTGFMMLEDGTTEADEAELWTEPERGMLEAAGESTGTGAARGGSLRSSGSMFLLSWMQKSSCNTIIRGSETDITGGNQ